MIKRRLNLGTGRDLFFFTKNRKIQIAKGNPDLERLRVIAEPYSTLAYKVHKGETRDDGSHYSTHLEQVVSVLDYMLKQEGLSPEKQRIINSSLWLHDSGEHYNKKNIDIKKLISSINRVDDDRFVKEYIIDSILYNSNKDDNGLREFLDGMLTYSDELQQFSMVAGKIADIWHNSGNSRDYTDPLKTMKRINKNETYILFMPYAREVLLNNPYHEIVDFERMDEVIADAVGKRKISTAVYEDQLFDNHYLQKAVSF